jgi:hypothetical protein
VNPQQLETTVVPPGVSQSIEEAAMNARKLKRAGMALAAPLAALALLVTAGQATAGAANAPALKGIGTLNCAAAGKVRFTPALSGSVTTTKIKVVVTLNTCSGSNAGATVVSGRITGTITGTPAGDCAANGFSTTGTLTGTYVVKSGHPPLKPSTYSFNTVRSFLGSPGFQGEVTGAVTAGSFFNTGSFLDLTSTQPSPCAAKWSAGGGGTFEMG